MSDFDPYYKWLGIPPQEQPPNHYRLLGLPNFERDLDVIENAADQRMSHVRTFQSGKHSKLSQRILNELSSARVGLLNPQQKAQYDAGLFAKLQQAQLQMTPLPQTPLQAAPFQPAPFQPGAPFHAPSAAGQPAQSDNALDEAPLFKTRGAKSSTIMRNRSRNSNRTLLVSGLVGLLLLVTAAAVYFNVNRQPKEIANNPAGSTDNQTDPKNNNTVTDPDNNKPTTVNKPPVKPPVNPPVDPNPGNTTSTSSQPTVKGEAPPYALKLDGRDYIAIPNAIELLDWTKPFTVEYWANWELESKELSLLGQWGQQADRQATGWGLTFVPAAQDQPFQLFIRYRDVEGNAVWYYKQMGRDTLDRWHHLAVCNDKEFLKLYLDGKEIGRFPVKALALSDHQPAIMSVGSDPNQMGFGASAGQIRGFRVSSTVRYAGPFTPTNLLPPDDATELSLDFSKPLLNEIRDLSKHGRHGRIVGARWVNSNGDLQSLAGTVPALAVGAIWKCADPNHGGFKRTSDGWLHETEKAGTEYYEVEQTPAHVELASVVGNDRLRLTKSEALTWDRLQMDWKPYYEGAFTNSAAVATTDDNPAAAEKINLLSKIDVKENTVRGKTVTEGETLTIESDNIFAQVMVPYTPPAEYEIEAHVTRVSGEDGFMLGIIVGGQQCVVNLDGWPDDGGMSGLETVTNLRPNDLGYENAYRGRLFRNDKESVVICKVTPKEVIVTCDGRQRFKWEGDPSELAVYSDFRPPTDDILFVGSWQSKYRVSKLELRPANPSDDSPLPTTFGKPAVVEKLPVPSAEEQAEGKKSVESILGDKLAEATDAAAKSTLATQLIAYSKDSSEKVATRYVLLTRAYELALDAANLILVVDVLDEVDRQFQDVDVWKLKTDALSKISAATKSLSERTNLASAAVALIDRALSDGHIDFAIDALAIATSAAAPPAGNVDLRKAIAERKKAVEALKPEWDTAKVAADKLKTDADDPQAHEVWGRFLCLVQRNWETGLPHLVRSSDAKLKVAAQQDLDRPARVNDQVALADLWWDLANELTDRKKESAQLRARLWYERAAPYAQTLLLQEKIKQRLDETATLASAAGGTATVGAVALPDNLPPEFAGMIGHMWIAGANTGAFFRYATGHTITDNQIDDLLARANKSRQQVDVILYGVLHVPEKTTVTILHNGGYYYDTNRVLIETVGAVSVVGGDLRDATGRSKNSDSVTLELPKGEHAVQWELHGKYGEIGATCDLAFVDADGKAMTVYHSRKLLTQLRGRNKDIMEIRLGQ